MGQSKRQLTGVVALVACLGVSGCMDMGSGGSAGSDRTGDTPTRMNFAGLFSGPKSQAAEPAAMSAEEAEKAREASESTIITELSARRTVLPQGSPYDEVADSVLAANHRTAEAELRSARLRAAAAQKNWLPQIGPSISLTSLGDFVTTLFVEQVLFDNGRKKAEREFAKADVEVAAVTLAQDTNDRVATAIALYLNAARNREIGARHQISLKDMGQFEWVMEQRVQGGISDMSDLNVLRQKLAEIRSNLAAAEEGEQIALAELNAMSIAPLMETRGVTDFGVNATDARPLDVILAQAEMHRELAQAKIDRADNLPGLKATGSVSNNGSDAAITAGGSTMFGLNTPDTLKAIAADKEVAERKVAQAQEKSNRELSRLDSQLTALSRQVVEATQLTQQAKANLDLFQSQYEAGQRQVMDVVGVYETYARRQQAQVDLKYDMAKARLEMARLLGLLADGSAI